MNDMLDDFLSGIFCGALMVLAYLVFFVVLP